jgi:hypothetical protein
VLILSLLVSLHWHRHTIGCYSTRLVFP